MHKLTAWGCHVYYRYDAQYGTALTRDESCDLIPADLRQQVLAFSPGRNLTDGK